VSHFAVLVITEPDKDVEEEVTRLLAPYDENDEWFREGSHWDWWVIGGRWTGHLDPSYDPYKDPLNYSPCEYCEGTGTTTAAVAKQYPAYEKNIGKPCIQCAVDFDGAPKPFPGMQLNFMLRRQDSDRAQPVREILERGIEPTLAVVTPDGAWTQGAQMGWWGMTSDEKEADAWKQEWHDLLVMHQDHVATIVDCHV